MYCKKNTCSPGQAGKGKTSWVDVCVLMLDFYIRFLMITLRSSLSMPLASLLAYHVPRCLLISDMARWRATEEQDMIYACEGKMETHISMCIRLKRGNDSLWSPEKFLFSHHLCFHLFIGTQTHMGNLMYFFWSALCSSSPLVFIILLPPLSLSLSLSFFTMAYFASLAPLCSTAS